MIGSFKDEEAEKLLRTGRSKRYKSFERVALRKLQQLRAAATLEDLEVPPGNRLEELKGDRKGQHSIRINDQFRICFAWREQRAYGIEIVDYH